MYRSAIQQGSSGRLHSSTAQGSCPVVMTATSEMPSVSAIASLAASARRSHQSRRPRWVATRLGGALDRSAPPGSDDSVAASVRPLVSGACKPAPVGCTLTSASVPIDPASLPQQFSCVPVLRPAGRAPRPAAPVNLHMVPTMRPSQSGPASTSTPPILRFPYIDKQRMHRTSVQPRERNLQGHTLVQPHGAACYSSQESTHSKSSLFAL